jgi:hypothetical protein
VGDPYADPAGKSLAWLYIDVLEHFAVDIDAPGHLAVPGPCRQSIAITVAALPVVAAPLG